jgi:hypothetical protein
MHQKPDKDILFEWFFPQEREDRKNRKNSWNKCLYIHLYDMLQCILLKETTNMVSNLNNELSNRLATFQTLPKASISAIWPIKKNSVDLWVNADMLGESESLQPNLAITSTVETLNISKAKASKLIKALVNDIWSCLGSMRAVKNDMRLNSVINNVEI